MSLPTRDEMETEIVNQLVTDLLAAGLTIKVENTIDPNGPDMIKTRDKMLILNNLGHMEEQAIEAYDTTQGRRVGFWFFVYGNDGYDVIADHSDTHEVEKLMKTVNLMIEEYQDRLLEYQERLAEEPLSPYDGF
jgi:hypothetical protein